MHNHSKEIKEIVEDLNIIDDITESIEEMYHTNGDIFKVEKEIGKFESKLVNPDNDKNYKAVVKISVELDDRHNE